MPHNFNWQPGTIFRDLHKQMLRKLWETYNQHIFLPITNPWTTFSIYDSMYLVSMVISLSNSKWFSNSQASLAFSSGDTYGANAVKLKQD